MFGLAVEWCGRLGLLGGVKAFPWLAKCRTSSQALAPVRFGAGVIGFCVRCGGVAWVNGLMVNRSEWSFFTGGKEYFLV